MLLHRRFLNALLLLLMLSGLAPAESSSALTYPIEFTVKPAAIVYSLRYAKINIIESHYALLAVQYSLLLAGIPYKIIDERDLLHTDLSKYSCLIFPCARYLSKNISILFLDMLDDWLKSGGSFICFGIPAYRRGNLSLYMDDWIRFYGRIFGLQRVSFRFGKDFSVSAERHRITLDHLGDRIPLEDISYDYIILSSSSNASVLLRTNIGDILALASRYGSGRAVLFTLPASDSFFQRTSIMLRSIQWCIYGDLIPVGLNLACGRVIWMLNIDADWSADRDATGDALAWLLRRSEKDCFTFSWAVITGNYSGLKKKIDWLSLKDLFNTSLEAGVEFASHTVHHPVWRYVTSKERVMFELAQSYRDIAGNLTIISGLQVPDGMFPIVYYPLIKKAGYEYAIQTFAYPFLRMVGIQPLHNDSIFIFWRSTKSDYYYFDLMKYSPKEAFRIEKENFDNFYALGHSAPYLLLWHDYSLINKTRRAVFLKVLKYEYANRVDVSSMTATEFIRRFEAWENVKIKITYMPDLITVQMDTHDVPEVCLQYLSCMCLRIDGKTISNVKFMNRSYPLFSDDYVILPELEHGRYEFKIKFGKPSIPHVIHMTTCRILSAELKDSDILLNLSRLWDNNARICLVDGSSLIVNGSKIKLERRGKVSFGYLTFKAVEVPKVKMIEAYEYFRGFLIGLILAFLLAVLVSIKIGSGKRQDESQGENA